MRSAADKRGRVFLVQEIRRVCAGKIAPSTLAYYETAWVKYVKFATPPPRKSHPRIWNPSVFADWFKHMVDETEYSTYRIRMDVTAVKSIVHYLHEAGIVDYEVWIRFKATKLELPKKFMTRAHKPRNRKLSVLEVRRICDSVMPDTRQPRTLFVRAAILTLATTGLKTAELCKLKVENLREKDGQFYILGVVNNEFWKKRSVPLASEAHQAIQDWLAFRPVQGPYIFNRFPTENPHEYESLWTEHRTDAGYMGDIIKQVIRDAGVKGVTATDIRNFVAARLAQKDVFLAQKILGEKEIGKMIDPYLSDKISLGITEGILG